MKTKLIAIALVPILFAGCGTGTSQQNIANAVIAAAEAAAPTAASLGTSAYLTSIKDPVEQAKVAAYFYSAANALYTFGSGTTPSPADVQQAVSQFAQGTYATQIANLILGLYASVYPQFGIAGKSPTVLLSNIAQGVMNAAKPYLKTTVDNEREDSYAVNAVHHLRPWPVPTPGVAAEIKKLDRESRLETVRVVAHNATW